MVKLTGPNAAGRDFQTLFEVGTALGLSDAELLDRFITRRDELALEGLVLRHGPMVWGVCRRVLRDHHDAEDAFQATFLALTRRASSIVPREKVGNWLYGVAYQTAMKARSTRAKRHMREAQVPDPPEPEAKSLTTQEDLAELLDHELSQLPDKYRTPIVLCELEGNTHGEAAERLGWPVGTVSGRLSRARAMLGKRLAKRAVVVSSSVLATFLSQSKATAAASMPPGLLTSTCKATCLFVVGKGLAEGAVSSEANALVEEVVKSMAFSKLKFTAVTLLALVLTGAGFLQAKSWVGGAAPAASKFHVKINEVLNEQDAIVSQIQIEVPEGATLAVVADDKSKGQVLAADLHPTTESDGSAVARLLIFGDQIDVKESATSVAKFMFAFNEGKISSSSSSVVSMPTDAKTLADVLKVHIKSGEYMFGKPQKLVTFAGVTYSVTVDKAK